MYMYKSVDICDIDKISKLNIFLNTFYSCTLDVI